MHFVAKAFVSPSQQVGFMINDQHSAGAVGRPSSVYIQEIIANQGDCPVLLELKRSSMQALVCLSACMRILTVSLLVCLFVYPVYFIYTFEKQRKICPLLFCFLF